MSYGKSFEMSAKCEQCSKEATYHSSKRGFLCSECLSQFEETSVHEKLSYQVVVMLTDQDGYDRPIIVAPNMELASKAFGEFIQIHKDNSYWRLNTQEYKAVPHVTESLNSVRSWFKNTGD